MRNLDEVLQRLQQWGALVNLGKCAFMQESVEYLGYSIDAEGVHSTGSKLEAIIGAHVPQNIQQLFIPDLATVETVIEFLAQEEPRMGLDGGLLEGIQDG